MAKPKLADLLKGAAGGSGEPSPSPMASAAPESPPPAATEPAPTAKAAVGGVAIRPRRVPTEEESRAQARRLMVRTFVRAFLTPGDTFMNQAACYRHAVDPESSPDISKQQGWRMMLEQDVKEEMQRQLRAIDRAADLDDQWVYDRWRAIAEADIFDYCKVDSETGVVHFDHLDPAKLTKEQRFAIQEIQIDQRTGRIKNLKLASKNTAVANVARARQMIDGKRDPGMTDLAQRLTERMNRAAARVGRTFDNDTGEQV